MKRLSDGQIANIIADQLLIPGVAPSTIRDMSRLPKMIDLMTVAQELETSDPNSKLAHAVKNAGRAQSCVADLALAADTLEALALLEQSRGWAPAVAQLAAEHALLANAIILYARATATSARAGERGHLSILDRLPKEDKLTHERLVAVRNTALAHVVPNQPLSDELWHHEVVFAVETHAGGWLPASVVRRVQANPSLASDLRQLLPKAHALLRETYLKRINYVAEQLYKTPDVWKLFEKHCVDPIAVFGSEEEARKALTSYQPGGRMSGIVDVPSRCAPRQ